MDNNNSHNIIQFIRKWNFCNCNHHYAMVHNCNCDCDSIQLNWFWYHIILCYKKVIFSRPKSGIFIPKNDIFMSKTDYWTVSSHPYHPIHSIHLMVWWYWRSLTLWMNSTVHHSFDCKNIYLNWWSIINLKDTKVSWEYKSVERQKSRWWKVQKLVERYKSHKRDWLTVVL